MKKILTLAITLFVVVAHGCKVERQPGAPPKNEINPISQDSTKAIYRQFFFSGTHNSYSGNLAGMNREGIKTQLERHLRFFEFDVFSYHTQNKLQKSWTEQVDNFIAFDYKEQTHLLTYSKANGQIKIYSISDKAIEVELSTTKLDLSSLAVLPFGADLYVFSYYSQTGNLNIYKLVDNRLSLVHSENIGSFEGKLGVFNFKEKAYLSINKIGKSNYRIYPLSLAGNIGLEDVCYELTTISLNETLLPFTQQNELYIFRHNANNVSNFDVTPVNTKGKTWTVESSLSSASTLLKGKIQAIQSMGKLYVNSYASNGDVTGARLVMDKGKPNLVAEYRNQKGLLIEADANIFPATDGYYLFLQKGGDIQLSQINIGKITLGHDAPGDEVDLNVDNPPSIFLADWLAYIADWSNKNPNHEPIFIMTELKEYEPWIVDSKWQNIIRLMQNNFGAKLRYHSSAGFHNEPLVDPEKIIDGETLYFRDKKGSKEGGLLGKVILYIQPNNNITESSYTNNFKPFQSDDGVLQANFLQMKRYRENNKLVSPDWRSPKDYGNDIGKFINNKDNSYISRIFHMQGSAGDGQYNNIRCTNVMFAVSDRPYDKGLYADYVIQQSVKNKMEFVKGCK